MKVYKLEEGGYESALYGFSLSYRKHGMTRSEWWTIERRNRIAKVAEKHAFLNKGRNKFLEHLQVWVTVEATLEWWKQFDTYRIGLSKQSESTMHTLDAMPISVDMFDIKREEFICDEDYFYYKHYLKMISRQPSRLKSKTLPQGFIQEREVNLNYKTIQHICYQRFEHRIKDWNEFIVQLIHQVEYPELLQKS